MRIGIDISQTAHRGTGVARYTEQLVDSVLASSTRDEYVFFYSSLRKPINKELAKKIQKKHTLKTFPFPPTLLEFIWNRVHVSPIESFIGKVDVFLSSDWTQPPSRNAKTVTVVHDLVVYTYPESSHPRIVNAQKRRLNWVKKECSRIITDSESTKDDLIKILKIPKEKISVVYPAVSTQIQAKKMNELTLERYNITKPFILSVGKLEPRKNISRLVQAFLQSGIDDSQLIIVGPKGWDKTNFKESRNVKFIGFVPDEELYSLYEQAEFFMYPSLYEGFGYPLIEAMQLGCPVATSNRSSMKELSVGAAELFDPEDVDAIGKTMRKLHNNKALLSTLSAKGKKRGSTFNQQNFSKTFLKVLHTL